MDNLQMQPAAGERLVRYIGDWLRFTLTGADAACAVYLRTNIGRAAALRREVINQIREPEVQVESAWRDVPMQYTDGEWSVEFALAEVGWFQAKAYVVDAEGKQHWPDGDNVGLSVHPNDARCANTIYCCFPRMFGPNKSARSTVDRDDDQHIHRLDGDGYTVIPPSGTFRDVIAELPHIMGTLGCRILHLLPVNSTPTTYARMGRFGSPYACGDLTDIDPALVQFDKRATGVQQFCELTDAVHARGGRLFLDLVINHTGWGSTLQENHPEWFLREENGEFASPGAWGNTWGDLVELEPHHRGLWEHLAESFLTWCRRGVDGFRCDAGYKVPMPVWRYIIARVREKFPDTIFLLEGLGGGWEETENLLTRGSMQWAYSELFQEYSGNNIAGYLDHALLQSPRLGTLIHYSETHDNPRLAERGRAWSLMRNRLSALTSVNGGYGFTNGVEWLADEKVNVHNARGMNWGSDENLVNELSTLNQLLAHHPCFRDGATARRLSHRESPIYALERTSTCGQQVLILANSDPENTHELHLERAPLAASECWQDLLGEKPTANWTETHAQFILPPGQVHCLAPVALDAASNYHAKRIRVAWAVQCLATEFEPEQIHPCDWTELSELVANEPEAFIAAIGMIEESGGDLISDIRSAVNRTGYRQVITWHAADATRVLPVPHSHWLMIHDRQPFRVSLETADSICHAESVPVGNGHVAAFAPEAGGEARLIMRRLDEVSKPMEGKIVFLENLPSDKPFETATIRHEQLRIDQPIALLTNGRGAMARMAVDLGGIKSKYDCLLGANLHASLPVDRHVLAKRLRGWAIADGFITPLNAENLLHFEPGPPMRWRFLVSAGDNRTVEVKLTAKMPFGENVTVLEFWRADSDPAHGVALAAEKSFSLTIRVDIEDRNFHCETKLDEGAYRHFENHIEPLPDGIGFLFQPEKCEQLAVEASSGYYHPEYEWCRDIAHPVEASRGHMVSGDACSPGWFEMPMTPGQSVNLTVRAPGTSPSGQSTDCRHDADSTFANRLKRSLESFVVQRGSGKTVIAGYPWFLDWGRDTLIVARGMLAAGMVDEVTEIVTTYAALEENGTLPNSLRGGDATNRDTSDAPLWLGMVCAELAKKGVDLQQLHAGDRSVGEVLQSIAQHYRDGTPNGIHVDESSGLVWSPTHFTWMDTNHPAGSPREGYPVEIQALWLKLLRFLGDEWRSLRQTAETSFRSLYLLEEGWLADQLIAAPGVRAAEAVVDNSLRSNGLLAVALGEVTGAAAQRMVLAAQRHLVVPGAVRSLAPLPVKPPLPVLSAEGVSLNNPDEPYRGRYEGDEDTQRKPAYHNGTAWVWSMPVFSEALARAWEFSPESVAAARSYLVSMEPLLNEGCLGHLPEVLDGDAPHTQRGCDAQAWSVSEAYRVWKLLDEK